MDDKILPRSHIRGGTYLTLHPELQLTGKEEMQLLLQCVRTLRDQVKAGQHLDLSAVLREAGLTESQIDSLIARWARLIQNIQAQESSKDTVLLERTESFSNGPLRLLLATLMPDYRVRLTSDRASPPDQPITNEQRSLISLTCEELHRLLQATLIGTVFSASLPEIPANKLLPELSPKKGKTHPPAIREQNQVLRQSPKQLRPREI